VANLPYNKTIVDEPDVTLTLEVLMTHPPVGPEPDTAQNAPSLDIATGAEARLALFQAVSRAVNSSLILEDIFEALGEVLQATLPYDALTLVILDDTQNGIHTLIRILADGHLSISQGKNQFAGTEPLVDAMVRQPQAVCLDRRDATCDPALLTGTVVGDGYDSAVVVPLVSKGVTTGLVALSRLADNAEPLPSQIHLQTHLQTVVRYQQAHAELLDEVAELLAVAIENARFYWQTQAQASRAFLVNQLAQSIRQFLDIDQILETAAQELGKVTGVSRCDIRYFGEAPVWTELDESSTNPADASPSGDTTRTYHYRVPGIAELRIPADSAIQDIERHLFTVRRPDPSNGFLNPFVFNDTTTCPASLIPPHYFADNHIVSMAVFPILVKDHLVGTITLQQCDLPRVWVGDDIALLEAIAEHLGIALSQAQAVTALKAQTEALQTALDELQQTQMHLIQSEKMAVLGQFVAGIAHEVNTPLGTIVSNNATLAKCVDKLGHAVPPEVVATSQPLFDAAKNLLEVNKLATDRIHSIVTNLRNFARLDESELKTVDLHEGIASTLILLQSSLPSHVTITRDFAPDLPKVACFPGLLNQVFMNLLVNAIHAVEALPQGQITIATHANTTAGQVEISVQDNGMGIPEANLKKIFDPGFTTKRGGVGTGLGLALCFKIVEKHHGHMTVFSTPAPNPNQGTIFTVQLPCE
jgi:signal transduction histidine kinase